MFELYYDFHIHSCLSPCGDDESTPTNIAALADILELDAVALTDHNSCKNCPAFFEAAKNYNFIPIAGMELTTAEDIHVVVLFPELKGAMEFDDMLYDTLLDPPYDPKILGEQILKNALDETVGTLEKYLIPATPFGIYELADLIKPYDGFMFPAHINRASFSLIAALGGVPDDFGFNTVEIRDTSDNKIATENLKSTHKTLDKMKILYNSDAHRLEDISLPVNTITVNEKSAGGILKVLRNYGFK